MTPLNSGSGNGRDVRSIVLLGMAGAPLVLGAGAPCDTAVAGSTAPVVAAATKADVPCSKLLRPTPASGGCLLSCRVSSGCFALIRGSPIVWARFIKLLPH